MRAPSIDYPFAAGPYLVSAPIAAGGMATIHLATTSGPNPRLLALKRLHRAMETTALFRNMLLEEGEISGRIRHPNVVTTHGVASMGGRLFLVMDYVEGVSLYRLMKGRLPGALPPSVVVAIGVGALHGLHAAHEAVDEEGRALGVVHRDVSPRNILVGADGVARIVDFGVAKAAGRRELTADGDLKGTLGYMAPEHVSGASLDRRADLFGLGVVLWEALTGAPLFHETNPCSTLAAILNGCTTPPSAHVSGIAPELDAVIGRALSVSPGERFDSALGMAIALEAAVTPADAAEVACWVGALGAKSLRAHARVRVALERAEPLGPEVSPLPPRPPLPRPTPPSRRARLPLASPPALYAVAPAAMFPLACFGLVFLLAAMSFVIAVVRTLPRPASHVAGQVTARGTRP